jgi:cellobiose phosphorylase
MFTMLNPVHHGSQPGAIERYKGKPYIMCADVYATPPHSGRGGWTWYTGEAG